jgi:hypothetical protein
MCSYDHSYRIVLSKHGRWHATVLLNCMDGRIVRLLDVAAWTKRRCSTKASNWLLTIEDQPTVCYQSGPDVQNKYGTNTTTHIPNTTGSGNSRRLLRSLGVCLWHTDRSKEGIKVKGLN